jgi:peptidoglycan hydrolase-like protein with peptidoglycan-binding domain
MNKITNYLESIRNYPFSKTHALQQELDEVRKAHAEVSADLANLRENLQDAHEDGTQQLVDLQQQMRQIESERNSAREQTGHLERALAEAQQRQKSMETDVSLLGTKLEEERSNARVEVVNLEHALTEAQQRQKATEARVGLLESKIEEERGNARKQVEQLERALDEAEQRQRSTEAHMGTLETMIQEERDSHAAGIHATETFLSRMQTEQEAHVKLQSELMDTLQDVTLRLQGTLQFQREKPNSSLLKLMVVAVVLFLTGTLAGVLSQRTQQDRDRDLAVVERDLSDLRDYMTRHINNQGAMLNELSLALNRKTSDEKTVVVEPPPTPEAETQAVDTAPQNVVAYEPDIRELQNGLIALGFDLGIAKPNGELGIKTRQALEEFRQFYLPQDDEQADLVSESLAALILKSADRARLDAARFNIGSDVLAAIRLGSIRTGVDFSFLMELARVESNFNPAARAPRSSATGLYQFKDHDWLEAIRAFGAEYGLQAYATRVKPVSDTGHEQQPIVRDPLQLEVLALRLNPRLSTLMIAETIRRNVPILSSKIGHEPGRTELYLAHYLGLDGALKFLELLDKAPATIAGDVFPEEAANNPGVFQGAQHQQRTVAEVYRWLDSKFNTTRYK